MKSIFHLVIAILTALGLQADNNKISVISHNVAKGVGDYGNVVKYLNGEAATAEQQADKENAGFNQILEANPDVLLLQELGMMLSEQERAHNAKEPIENHYKERPIHTILATQREKYQLIYFEGKKSADCYVVINTERFELVANHSYNLVFQGFNTETRINEQFHRDVAIAHVRDRTNNHNVVLVSAYVPGFNFDDPEPDRIDQGDEYLEHIAQKLHKARLGQYNTIIGGDMNITPQKASSLSLRFQKLRIKGLLSFWTGQSTNVNMTTKKVDSQLRELDCFFLRTPRRGFFQLLFGVNQPPKLVPSPVQLFPGLSAWDCPNIWSDHLPLIWTLSWE
jgi:exonuclease III